METIKEIVLKSMNNKTVRYDILENRKNGKISYGIKIFENYNGNVQEEVAENISDNKETVLKLINYLSENVIDTAHFKDVIEDYEFLTSN